MGRAEQLNLNNKVVKDLIALAKACPGLQVTITLGDLLEASKQLIALAKHELEQEIADSKAETYISREKVMEITGKSSTTIWRWQKINYLVPVSPESSILNLGPINVTVPSFNSSWWKCFGFS